MSTIAAFSTVSPSGSDAHWRVAASLSSQLLLSSSQNERAFASITNHAAGGLYIRFGSNNVSPSGTNASFDVKIASGSMYELPKPIWQGEIWGAWDATSGWAMVFELGDND